MLENHKLMEQATKKKTKRWKLDVLSFKLVTRDTFQSPITPLGFPAVPSFDAAKIGQDPSAVSPKHP